MDWRGDTQGDIVRAATAAAGAREIDHEDVGGCQVRVPSVSTRSTDCAKVFHIFVRRAYQEMRSVAVPCSLRQSATSARA